MLHFSGVLERIFSGFAVNADTLLLQELLDQDEQDVFIIKKSKYYITLLCLPAIITIIVVAGVNIGLFFFTKIFPDRFQRTLAGALGINIVRWFITIILYLRTYNTNYKVFKIMPAKDRIPVLKRGDTVFRNFFNQTIRLILSYIIIIVAFIGGVVFLLPQVESQTWLIICGNLILFLRQFRQIVFLLRKFVNLEMDFVIVTKWQMKHYDQQRMGIKTKTIDTAKIKTIKSHKLGKLRSILNYGEVHVFTDGDVASRADLELKHIIRPETIEKLLYQIKSDAQKNQNNNE